MGKRASATVEVECVRILDGAFCCTLYANRLILRGRGATLEISDGELLGGDDGDEWGEPNSEPRPEASSRPAC